MCFDVSFKCTLWTKDLLERDLKSGSLHKKRPFLEIFGVDVCKLILPECMQCSTSIRTRNLCVNTPFILHSVVACKTSCTNRNACIWLFLLNAGQIMQDESLENVCQLPDFLGPTCSSQFHAFCLICSQLDLLRQSRCIFN